MYEIKEMDYAEQKSRNVMYSDFILSFDEYVEAFDGTQAFSTCYLPVLNDEYEQLMLIMQHVSWLCDEFDMDKTKLYKISTACNWTLFTELTGDEATYVKGVNGKFYFGNRNDLDAFEKAITEHFDFGTDYYLEGV